MAGQIISLFILPCVLRNLMLICSFLEEPKNVLSKLNSQQFWPDLPWDLYAVMEVGGKGKARAKAEN